MNKATNAPILQDGKEITSTLAFIADKVNGTKDLEFVVNASVLKGQTIVVLKNFSVMALKLQHMRISTMKPKV